MKKIDKRSAPVWFQTWKDDFEVMQGRKPHYEGDFSTDESIAGARRYKLRKELVAEQGGICCYCMSRISPESEKSHIEHFWPKDHFPDKDMEYDNLFASCQGNYESEDYCGHRKNDWWDEKMIPPTDILVEKIFVYTEDGKIHSVKNDSHSNIAQKMIANLGLDSYHLERNRRQAIEGSEVFDEIEYSQEDIREFIRFYDNKQEGVYVPYCKAIVDCLVRML